MQRWGQAEIGDLPFMDSHIKPWCDAMAESSMETKLQCNKSEVLTVLDISASGLTNLHIDW